MQQGSDSPLRLHRHERVASCRPVSRHVSQQSHQPSLLNRSVRVLLCLVFIHAVIGKLTGSAGVGAIADKGLPRASVPLVAAMALVAVGSGPVISGWKAQLGAACCWWATRAVDAEGGELTRT